MMRTATPLPLLVTLLAAGCAAELGNHGAYASHDDAEEVVTLSTVSDLWSESATWLESPVLESLGGASRVGAMVGLEAAGPMPALEARPVAADGTTLGDWVPLSVTWSEEDLHVAVAELGTVAAGAQIRMRADAVDAIRSLRWNAVVPEPEADLEPVGEEEVGGAGAALRSELRGIGIVTREAWGARATRCTSANASKSRMAIHYTVTPAENPERQVRGIQRYHMDSRGWCDVGYHFLVGIDGTLYEGRPLHLLGAHVSNNNTGNIGISFVGCFDPSCRADYGPKHPSDAMLRSGANLIRELSRVYGITIDRTRIKGHREHSGQSTSCPGANLLPRIDSMLSMARSGGSSTPPPPSDPPPATGASCTHTYGGTYGHLACSPSYQCCNGSWRTRGACGGCACTESTGEIGCGATPPGDPCTHTYGGRYGHLACSPSYQCCNGTWRTRGACGGCTCTESTGERGCGL